MYKRAIARKIAKRGAKLLGRYAGPIARTITQAQRPGRFYGTFGRRQTMRTAHSEVFKEAYEATVNVSHTTGDYGITIAPYMSLLGQMTNYAALYDQYKVWYIDIKWMPFMQNPNSLLATNATGNTGTNLISGIMHRAYDPDDNTAPSAASTMLDYKKNKTSNVFRSWRSRIYPQVFKAIDGTGYGTEPARKYWIDIANQAVVLHGLKVYIEDIGYRHASVDLAIGKFVVTVAFSCRTQI